MADVKETVESSAAETVESQETTAPPAEALNTVEQETETKKTAEKSEEAKHEEFIPYHRLAEATDKKNEALHRVEELEGELEKSRAAKAPETAVPSTELTEPPEHLSQREKVDFYVRQGAERLMQDKLGMNLDQVKTLLQTIPGVSDATYEQQWQRMCEAKGLDPNDRTIQDLTRGLVKGSGHDVQDALSVVANLVGKKKAATSETTPQIMENGATAHTMTKENVDFVWDKGAAMTLASQGKLVDNASAVDILKAAEKISKAKAAEK